MSRCSLRCFNGWSRRGTRIVVIEHNLEVIKCADWIIDLGPEAGEEGGQLVAAGTPEQVAQRRGESHRAISERRCCDSQAKSGRFDRSPSRYVQDDDEDESLRAWQKAARAMFTVRTTITPSASTARASTI